MKLILCLVPLIAAESSLDPTPSPTPNPTPSPTASPTPSPTAAPTATCPVTCTLDSGKISAVHDVYQVNAQDSYTQHRCYSYNGQCVCECILNEDNFQSGTWQGLAAGSSDHRGSNTGQSIQTVEAMKTSGKFWKAPSYKIDADEVAALRACCNEEFEVAPELLLPAKSCADIEAASDEEIIGHLENHSDDISNSKILAWLHEQECAHHI
jgi:hypothetical protein